MTVLKKGVCGLSLKTSCYIVGWSLLVAAILSCTRLAYLLSPGFHTADTEPSHHAAAAVKANDSGSPTMATQEHLNVSRKQAAEMYDQDPCVSDDCRLTVAAFLVVIIFLVVPANAFLLKGTTNDSSIYLMVWLIIYSPMGFANIALIFISGLHVYQDDANARILFYGSTLHLTLLVYMWLLVFSHHESLRKVRTTVVPEGPEHVRLSVVCREVRVRAAAPTRERSDGDDDERHRQRHDAARDPLTREGTTPPPAYSECQSPTAVGKDRAGRL